MKFQARPEVEECSTGVPSQELRMNRWLAILYVVICFEMGASLFLFPWVPLWSENFFVGHYQWVNMIAQNYYIRGGVSGLGLIDVFLALHEVWRLRRSIGLVQ